MNMKVNLSEDINTEVLSDNMNKVSYLASFLSSLSNLAAC